jgi:hypothetical protein
MQRPPVSVRSTTWVPWAGSGAGRLQAMAPYSAAGGPGTDPPLTIVSSASESRSRPKRRPSPIRRSLSGSTGIAQRDEQQTPLLPQR